MPITIVAKGIASATTTNPAAPSYPANVLANDILFLLAVDHQPVSVGVVTASSNWTLINQSTYSNNSAVAKGRASLWWQRAVGGENGVQNLSRTGDTGTDGCFFAQIYQVRGCITTGNPYDNFTSQYGVNSSVKWNAVNVSDVGRTLLALFAGADNISCFTPTNYSVNVALDTTATGTDAQLQLFGYTNQASDGQVLVAGGNISAGWATFHLSLTPVPEYPSVGGMRGSVASLIQGLNMF